MRGLDCGQDVHGPGLDDSPRRQVGHDGSGRSYVDGRSQLARKRDEQLLEDLDAERSHVVAPQPLDERASKLGLAPAVES